MSEILNKSYMCFPVGDIFSHHVFFNAVGENNLISIK